MKTSGLRISAYCLSVALTAVAVMTSSSTGMSAGEPAIAMSTGGTAALAGPQPLFTQVATAPALSRTVDPRVIRRATLAISGKALASGVIQNGPAHLLNLFPDVQIVSLRHHVESHTSSDFTWYGKNHGDEFGETFISLAGGAFSAVVLHRGLRYTILPRGDGFHDLLEMNDANFIEGNDVDTGRAIPPLTPLKSSAPRVAATPLDAGGLILVVPWSLVALNQSIPLKMEPVPDDGSSVDVLVLYTHEAALYTDPLTHNLSHSTAPANMMGRILASGGMANWSLMISGAQTRFNYVPHVFGLELPPEYTEANGVIGNVEKAENSPWILAVRDLFAADVVVVVTSGIAKDVGDNCGWAREYAGFAVVLAGCMPSYIFAHELGHLLFLDHDWDHLKSQLGDSWQEWDWESPPIPTLDKAGYVQIAPGGTSIRSIMAYPTKCIAEGVVCPTVGRWSDPNHITQANLPFGIPLGEPYPSNELRVLNVNRVEVARYRPSACRLLPLC